MPPARRPHMTLIVGSGRDLVRVAPLYRELRRRGNAGLALVLTGQERDADLMSGYFRGLTLPQPDGLLEPGVGTRSEQAARTFAAVETFLRHDPTDLVVLQGGSDLMLACAVICRQQGIALAQLEAGLRSPGRSENLIGEVVDHLCDYWFAPFPQAAEALAGEGLAPERILQPGNLMLDTLHACREAAAARTWETLDLREEFGAVLLSSPRMLDNPMNLRKIAEAIAALSDDIPIAFPLSPEARRRLGMWRLDEELKPSADLHLPDARGFVDTFALIGHALFVITDAPDLQDQASFVGVPCLTVAEATDRPVTVEQGTNLVIGPDTAAIVKHCEAILEGRRKQGALPEDDGQVAGRIADSLEQFLASARGQREIS